MDHESHAERVSNEDQLEVRQDRKPWVTPVVSESPVNELTADSTGTATDGALYS